MSNSRTLPLVGTLLFCATIPVVATVCQQAILGDWRAEHYLLHALAGGLGAFAAVTLAIQLRTLRRAVRKLKRGLCSSGKRPGNISSPVWSNVATAMARWLDVPID